MLSCDHVLAMVLARARGLNGILWPCVSITRAASIPKSCKRAHRHPVCAYLVLHPLAALASRLHKCARQRHHRPILESTLGQSQLLSIDRFAYLRKNGTETALSDMRSDRPYAFGERGRGARHPSAAGLRRTRTGMGCTRRSLLLPSFSPTPRSSGPPPPLCRETRRPATATNSHAKKKPVRRKLVAAAARRKTIVHTME